MREETFEGLSHDEVLKQREIYGRNELEKTKKTHFLKKILSIIFEPMFLLLIVAASVYFILGEPIDGMIMLIFVFAVIITQMVQEGKTDKTLSALRELSAPCVQVIRGGKEVSIPAAELVPRDIMRITEGDKVAADGIILTCNDLCAHESMLTGESAGVWKSPRGKESDEENNEITKKDCVYAGTVITKGSAYVEVTKTGGATEYGKIGKMTAEAQDRPTPLEKQTGKIIKVAAVTAVAFVILVGIITFIILRGRTIQERITESILAGITLAMSVIPEEIPLVFTIFLSMGAWRLAKKNSLMRKMSAIETLGAVSVLCVDKTGTITKNIMTVSEVFAADGKFVQTLGLACEQSAYDPMEKAMLAYCAENGLSEGEIFQGELLREYAFTDELKMMGHVWRSGEKTTLSVKGAPEGVLDLCVLSEAERAEIAKKILQFSEKGLRVIAVACADLTDGIIPEKLTDCRLNFSGIAGLYDPPRDTVAEDIAKCLKAKIKIVMITGDSGITALNIARKIGMPDCGRAVTGAELNCMSDAELCECVKTARVFSRVLPEHKMRIVKAFQNNGETVAMTGDGVNDAAALKHSDVGIAMGKRGSQVCREAADMVLLDDNFSTIVSTVRDGRRIYQNIRAAIGYVLSVHIPVALAALVVTLIGVSPQNFLLLPFHVMLLELIIDPTCSIVMERRPPDSGIMCRAPRKKEEPLIGGRFALRAILQGLVIFALAFGTYLYFNPEKDAERARTAALAVIVFSSLFLVFVNSSDGFLTALAAAAKDKIMMLAAALTLCILLAAVYLPVNSFLKLAPLSAAELLSAFALAAAATLWYEIPKYLKNHKK